MSEGRMEDIDRWIIHSHVDCDLACCGEEGVHQRDGISGLIFLYILGSLFLLLIFKLTCNNKN